jgi:hypothetical protein
MRGEPAVGDRVVQVAAGSEHSLALIDAGHVLSWGKGDYGDGNGPLGNQLTPKEKRDCCRALPKLVTLAPKSSRDSGDFLFDMYDRYKVMRRAGVAVHADPSFSSRSIHEFVLGDELNVDRAETRDGMMWVHHAHGLGDDCDAVAPGGGDGQGWVCALSEEGHVQLQQLPRRKPVQLIQAGGERSYAFTGDRKPLRRHLAQV